MAAKAKKPEYAVAVRAARAARISNAAVCGLGMALTAAAAAAGALLAREYTLLAVSAAAMLLVPLLAVLAKNLGEVRAIARIARTGTYAAKLSDRQQETVREHLARQGTQFYLTAFLAVATPESAILVGMSTLFKSDLFLLIMAIFALAALAVAALAGLYLRARLRVSPAFLTVSSQGVLAGREVMPFEAKDGEVLSLIRFDDYYRIEFVKREILGIRRNASVLVPVDGVLKNGIEGNVDEILARTLGLKRITIIHSPYYDSRDYSEQAVNALAAQNLRAQQG